MHPAGEEVGAAAVAQGVIDQGGNLVGQVGKQQREESATQRVRMPSAAGEKAIVAGVVLVGGEATCSLDDTADGVPSGALEPAHDEDDEVLEAGSGEAGSEV